jgi:hypothetical protein
VGIHKAFEANANCLKSDCNACGTVNVWFEYVSYVFLILGLTSLLPPLLLAVVTGKHMLEAPTFVADQLQPPLDEEESVRIQRYNNWTSWLFFFVLSLGIVVTDGILESALAGLLTVSLLYSIWRIKSHTGSECWRAMEVLTVLLVILVGEIALNYGFGATLEYRNAAKIFDSSVPTKILGYCTFVVGFGVVIWENSSNLRTALRGFRV